MQLTIPENLQALIERRVATGAYVSPRTCSGRRWRRRMLAPKNGPLRNGTRSPLTSRKVTSRLYGANCLVRGMFVCTQLSTNNSGSKRGKVDQMNMF